MHIIYYCTIDLGNNMAKHNDIAKVETEALQPLEQIENLIHVIRGKQVMLDRDLARL